jgi:hypothetical protein
MFQPRAEQAVFLGEHGISADQVLDARGMTKSEYYKECKDQDKLLAFTPQSACKKAGHTLRNRHGQCVQCRPESLSRLQEYNKEAWVYILWSESLQLFKIGKTNDIGNRRRQTNEGYGGAKDWMTVYSRRFKKAGDVETRARQYLKTFEKRPYMHRDKIVMAQELFQCTYDEARAAVEVSANDAVGPADDGGRIITRWRASP